MKKNWNLLQPDIRAVKKLSSALNRHPLVATLLINRNITNKEEASRFLRKSINDIRSPFSLKDMDAAVRRIAGAIADHEKILIFGDYDVDGITAVTILYEFFKYTGADVSYYIPHRLKEGYGLRASHITDYVQPNNISLVITVDCGSGSFDAVTTANDAGIDIIITDHHKISDNLPEAAAIINPCRRDCDSGFNNLAGVGVAFCLLICLRKYLRDNNFWDTLPEPNLKKMSDLVALGTIADVVPVIGENRIFINMGLETINAGERSGLAALTEVSGINSPNISTDDIGFRLAPRLNAAGRLDHASRAVELLTSGNRKDGKDAALALNDMNKTRQDTEKRMFDGIVGFLEQRPDILERNSFVLAHNSWHEGILGIIASRLVKKYFRPVVLITTKNGLGKGSARSIPGFDLFNGLLACEKDLLDFGGHTLAAGLQIDPGNIDRFRKNFETTVDATTQPDDFVPSIEIDSQLEFDSITEGLMDAIESLQPFGNGNPEPVFLAGNITVSFSKIAGKNHRQMILKQATGRGFKAIHFNIDPSEPVKEKFNRIAFHLQWNRWKGTKTIQLVIVETD